MTSDEWLARHPYLQPVAELRAVVDETAEGIDLAPVEIPDWDGYRDDFHAGVPLLESTGAAIDLPELQDAVLTLIRKLASAASPPTLSEQCRTLDAEMPSGELPTQSGLLRFLGCTVLARYLAPVVDAFGKWRDEDRWLRNYCPTCGTRPAMAQLVGVDPGRLRLLSCGSCTTRWRYRRTACPFCDLQHEHKLASLAIDGEDGLRIDYCESCRGYLKTYAGQGNERLLLADWTSLHLDLLARDRGLRRLASSLYEL